MRSVNGNKRTWFAMAALAVGAAISPRAFAQATYTWDSSGANPSAPVDGSGNWDLSTADWSNHYTDIVWPNDNSIATFGDGGTAGTVTVATSVNAGAILFNPVSSGSYTIAGSAITLNGTDAIGVLANSATISAPIAGTNLIVGGTGTLTLAGTNTYSGTTTVEGTSTLKLGAAGTLPATTGLIVNSGATLDVNGFTQTATSLAGAGNVTLESGSNLILNETGSSTFSGTLSGAGTLTKNNTGTLTITSPQTNFTGTLAFSDTTSSANNQLVLSGNANVNNGSIVVNNTVTSSGGPELTLNNLATALTAPITFNPGNGGFRFSINVGGGTNNVVSGPITANYGTSAPQLLFFSNTAGASMTVTSNVTVNDSSTAGTGLIVFRGADAQTFTGMINAPSNIGVSTTDAGSLLFEPQAGSKWGVTTLGGSYTLKIASDSAITDGTTISGATNSLLIAGGRLQLVNYSSNLSFNQSNFSATTTNLYLGAATGAPSTFNGSVTFNDTSNPVNFNGPGTLLFNGSLNYPTDSGGNPQSGTITISAGTLQLGNASAFPVVAAPTISSGATLDLNGNYVEMKAISGAGNLMLSNGATLQLDASTGTLSGTVSGTGELYIYTGNLTLSGNNTYSGGTVIGNASSTLTLGSATGLGTGDVQLFGTLAIGSFSPTLGSLYGNGAASVTGSGNLTVGADNNSQYFSGVIKTTGSLTVTGTGTFTLDGNNTYTGGTTVSSGTLQLGVANALPTTTGLTIAAGGTFDMQNQSQQIASLAGAGSIINTGALTIGGTTSTTFTGTMASGGSLTFAPTATGTLTINSDAAVGGTSGVVDWASGSTAILKFANYSSGLSFNSAGNVILGSSTGAASTLTGNVSGSSSLTFAGPGILVLNPATGSNTYTGGTVINGGNLQFASANALPAGSTITINSGGALDITGAFPTVASALPSIATTSAGAVALTGDSSENIDFTNYSSLSLGAQVNSNYTGTITPGSNGYNLGGGGANLTLPGTNALTGANKLNVANSGTVTLTGSNNFTGAVTLTSGTLAISSDAAINNAVGGITFSGGILQFNNYSSSNLPAFNNDTSLKLGAASGAASTVNEAITGTSALTYQGPGTLLLGTSVTLPTTSALTVNAGTLDLNGHSQTVGSLTGAGSVAIESGSTLSLGSASATTASSTTYSGALTGAGGFTKNNLGTLTLTGTSTLTGPISIIQNSNATGTNPTSIVLSGANANINSASIYLTNSTGVGSSDWPILALSNLSTPLSAPITVTLGGGNDFRAAIQNNAGNNTVNSPITYNSTDTSTSTFNFLSSAGTMTVNSAITATGVKPQITFRGAGSGVFNGSITESGTANLIVAKTDAGLWILNPAPGGTWATTGISNGTIQMGGANLLPTTSLLQLAAASATFDMAGYSQTVTGLTGTSTTDIVTSSTTAATLTINVPAAATTDTFGGATGDAISGPLTITIAGTGVGTEAFAGANTYTGGTNLNGGKLSFVTGALGSGPVSFNGGTLVYSGTNTTDLTANGLTINSGGATINTGTNAVTFANAITSGGPFTLSGGSLHIAASNNTIAGALTINGSSTLQLDGNTTAAKLAGDGTGTLNITAGKVAATTQGQSTLSLAALNIGPSGVLDIDNGNIAINYGTGADPIATVVSYLKDGYNLGNWNGSTPVNGSIDASGVVRGATLGYADSLLAAHQVEVKYTWYGDLNLDGVVNSADAAMMGALGTGNVGWTGGDLNYDGVVNADDYSLFLLGAASQNGSISAGVPEPTAAALALLPLAAGWVSRRRRS